MKDQGPTTRSFVSLPRLCITAALAAAALLLVRSIDPEPGIADPAATRAGGERAAPSREARRSRPAMPASLDNAADPRAEFASALREGDFEAAVDRYDRIYTTSSTDQSGIYRDLILEHASRLIQTGRPGDAVDLLQHYLSIYYADVDALIIQGRAYREHHEAAKAIDALQQAYQLEYRLGVRELIINQANTLIGEVVQEFKDQNKPEAVVDLYERLTKRQPEVPGYFIGLANAYASQHRYEEAVRTLNYIQQDATVGPRARMLISEIEALKPQS